jgi:predicted Zn-dependent protease
MNEVDALLQRVNGVVAQASQLAAEGEVSRAIDLVEEEMAVLPNVLELRVLQGLLYAKRNDRRTARSILSRALESAPEHELIQASLAQLMYLDGEYKRAAEAYQRALASRPNDAASRLNLAASLLELGECHAAEREIRVLAKSHPKLFGKALTTLASASHGRFFLKPSAAASFMRGP